MLALIMYVLALLCWLIATFGPARVQNIAWVPLGLAFAILPTLLGAASAVL